MEHISQNLHFHLLSTHPLLLNSRPSKFSLSINTSVTLSNGQQVGLVPKLPRVSDFRIFWAWDIISNIH